MAATLIVATDWGSVAEWVSGIGALLAAAVAAIAAIVALKVSNRAQSDALETRKEARSAASRDRAADLLVQLVTVVERDIAQAEKHGHRDLIARSAEGQALCRALWSRRNLFGTTWAVYCEPDQAEWVARLRQSGELWNRMRAELQTALDSLDHEDRSA